MHDLQRAVRVPGNLHFVAVSSEREFRHQPLANTSTDLTISWIEFAVIRDLYDLVRTILQQHLPCGAVALAEAVDITDRPTAKFLHWACHIAAVARRLSVGHSGADGVGDLPRVVICAILVVILIRAILRKLYHIWRMEKEYTAGSKWFGLGTMLFVTFPEIAAAQGTNTFEGTYVGVSASNLGGIQRGSTSGGCRTFNCPCAADNRQWPGSRQVGRRDV